MYGFIQTEREIISIGYVEGTVEDMLKQTQAYFLPGVWPQVAVLHSSPTYPLDFAYRRGERVVLGFRNWCPSRKQRDYAIAKNAQDFDLSDS